MKKCYISLFLAAIMIFPASAAHLNSETNTMQNNLYISSLPCPEGYIQYALEHAAGFTMSMDNVVIEDYSKIAIGTPFTFSNLDSDIYYFPILYGQDIVYLFRVMQDTTGQYHGVMSPFLANELNNLASETSIDTPLKLYMSDRDIIAQVGPVETVLFTYPDDYYVNEDTPVLLLEDNELETTNAMEILYEGIISSYPEDKMINPYLDLPITSTQGNRPWCDVYAATAILCYKGFSVTPEALAAKCGVTDPSVDVSTTTVISCVNKNYGLKVTLEDPLSMETLYQELYNNRPVLLAMYQKNPEYENAGHAVVLRGIYVKNNSISIWNPWYEYYESFTYGGFYIPTEAKDRYYLYTYTYYPW